VSRTLRLLLALAAVAAVGAGTPALAGCGGSDREAERYVEQVNAAQQTFADRFAAIQGRLTTTSSPAQDRRALREFGTATDRIVRDLRAVPAPERVDDLHLRLVAAVAGYGTQIERARGLLEEGDRRQAIRARTELSGAVGDVSRQITTAITAINRRLQG
jgi:hypothetical protein